MLQRYTSAHLKIFIVILTIVISGNIIKANNYYVTAVSDTGLGSLRAAIDSANANPGLDSIVLQLSVQDTIYLANRLPVVTDSLVITGLPCQNPSINGGLLPFAGAALIASSTTKPLTLNYLNFFNCLDTSASAPGGAVNAHILYVNYCYLAGNEALANTGSGKGGAIYANNLWIDNSTFNGNTASSRSGTSGIGGAVYSPTLSTFYNCTFNFNYAALSGGAIASLKSVLSNCTIVNNSAGVKGGAYSSISDSVSISNSIIWSNTTPDSAAGTYFTSPVNSGGCNVLQVSNANFNFITSSSDVMGVDPMLDTLGYFSGCVPVVPIFCGSIAQDHATCNGATTSDAEGIAAVGPRDAGAFEITLPVLGMDTIDSIQPGDSADLMNYFNTTGLTFRWYGNFADSSKVDTGTYTIIAFNYLGCADTATVTIRYATDTTSVDSTTGIRTLNDDKFGISLFPNPANTIVNVRLSSAAVGPLDLKMFDATGRVVMVQNISGQPRYINVNISAIQDGLYYLQLKDAVGNYSSAALSIIAR